MLDDCTMCGNPDYDNDTVLNDEDNCPNDYNPGQEDEDMDNIGDSCDDCHNLSGDPSDDMFVTVNDIILVVQMITNGGYDSEVHSNCEKADGNFNNDSVINVLDIIQMINVILGNTVSNNSKPSTESAVNVDFSKNGYNIILSFSSLEAIHGIQINSDFSNSNAKLVGNDDKEFISNENVILSYSLQNNSFSNFTKIEIQNGQNIKFEDFIIIISNENGQAMNLVKSEQGDIFSYNDLEFKLTSAYPNPFNPTTQLNFTLPFDGQIKLDAYNLQGQQVAEIFSGFQQKGQHQFSWDASQLTSGIYFVKLTAGNHLSTLQTVLMK
jgi:hypothetical protein